MRRLGVFLLYDRDGKVSDHVVYLLANFSRHIERLIVMSNGPLAAGQEERVAPYVDQLIVRPNVGFDVGAYIDGILTVGFDALAEYDELVLFNYTVFGPIFDIGEMFGEMAKRDVDFWGVTQYHDRHQQFLQSYFLVTRRRLHASRDFREYWLNMPEIASVEDSIHFHEFRFTPFFCERGYVKDVYVENDPRWQGNTTLVDLPGLIEKRNPVIKYRAFNFEPQAIESRGGLTAAFNFDYMRSRTDYPVDLIWDYILSQSSSDQIIDAITGARVTCETGELSTVTSTTDDPVVPVIFVSIEQEGAVAAIADYLSKINPARFYLTSSNERIVRWFAKLGWVTVRTERPMSGAPIAAFADQIMDIVAVNDAVINLSCFVEEREEYYFRQHLMDNYWGPLVSSAETLRQVKRQFDENPRIGLLFAPTNSVAGRIRRKEGLCPRASNWSFTSYPADVSLAPDQNHWPWRGNAALSGRLVRHPGFVRRLAELTAEMKIVKGQRNCGSEGFIAELARRSGFAAALAVSARQAAKLVTRHSAVEGEVRRAAAQQAGKYNREIAALRQATLEKAPATVVKPTEETANTKVTELEQKLTASQAATKAANSRTVVAERALATARTELEAAKGQITQANAALEVSRETRRAAAVDLEALFRHLTPAPIRSAVTLEQQADGSVTVNYLESDAKGERQTKSISMASDDFAFGRVTEIRSEKNRLNIKGWVYNRSEPESLVFVSVISEDKPVAPFVPCLRRRAGLRSKVSKALPHEQSGFNLTFLQDATAPDKSRLKLILVDQHTRLVMVQPLEEAKIGEAPAGKVPKTVKKANSGKAPTGDVATTVKEADSGEAPAGEVATTVKEVDSGEAPAGDIATTVKEVDSGEAPAATSVKGQV